MPRFLCTRHVLPGREPPGGRRQSVLSSPAATCCLAKGQHPLVKPPPASAPWLCPYDFRSGACPHRPLGSAETQLWTSRSEAPARVRAGPDRQAIAGSPTQAVFGCVSAADSRRPSLSRPPSLTLAGFPSAFAFFLLVKWYGNFAATTLSSQRDREVPRSWQLAIWERPYGVETGAAWAGV